MVKLVDLKLVVGKAVTSNVYNTVGGGLEFGVWQLMYPSPITYIYNDTRDMTNKNNWRKVNKSGRKLFITGVRGTRC